MWAGGCGCSVAVVAGQGILSGIVPSRGHSTGPPSPHPQGLAQADPFAALRILVTLSHLPVPTPAPGAWQSSPLPSYPLPGPHVHAQCLTQGPLAKRVPARPPEGLTHTQEEGVSLGLSTAP